MISAQSEESGILVFMHDEIGTDVYTALRKRHAHFSIECHLVWEDVFGKIHKTTIILHQMTPMIHLIGSDLDREGELSAHNQGH